MTPDERREVIIDAGVHRVTVDGYDLRTLSRDDVTSVCTIPTSRDTVKRYFTMRELRDAVRDRITEQTVTGANDEFYQLADGSGDAGHKAAKAAMGSDRGD